MKTRQLAALFLLVAVSASSPAPSPAQTAQTTDPWCQAHTGDRIVLGQFPYFSCVERAADCKLYPSPCTPSEIAMIVMFGGQYQAPGPPDRIRPTAPKRRLDRPAALAKRMDY